MVVDLVAGLIMDRAEPLQPPGSPASSVVPFLPVAEWEVAALGKGVLQAGRAMARAVQRQVAWSA